MLAELRLKHYRSYIDDSFEFIPAVNIIVGPNASGKTNLLEAILVISRGHSYRAKDGELVHFGSPWARLDARTSDGQERTCKFIREPAMERSFEIDSKPFKRLGLKQSLPVVLFEPNHLLLLSGGPEMRRTYLDDLLEQTVAHYGKVRREYKRTLAQRNALLKHAGINVKTQVFPWNIRLSQLAGQVVRARTELIEIMQTLLPGFYQNLSRSHVAVSIRYDMPCSIDVYETYMLKKLETGLEYDLLRGYTAFGPHREDIIILFDGHPASEVASRGEVRTFILALKVIELKRIEASREQAPLLLLDDVFSELDGARRHALTDYLSSYQTFITTTDADLVLHRLADQCQVIALDERQ